MDYFIVLMSFVVGCILFMGWVIYGINRGWLDDK